MATEVKSQKDHNENEILGFVPEKLASHPGTPSEGRTYYNTTAKTVYFYDGTAWVDIGGDIKDVQNTLPITVSIVSGVATLGINAATGSNPGSMSAADKTKLDAATDDKTSSTLMLRDGAGRVSATDGVDDDHLVTKNQLDLYKNDFDRKESILCRTTGALSAYTFSTNKLTATGNGAFPTLDGVTVVTDGTAGADDGVEANCSRVAVIDESGANEKYNGLYYLSDPGDGSNPWVLTRTSDANADAEVTAGMYFFVDQGTTHANSAWVLKGPDPITLNTTALSYLKYSGVGSLSATSPVNLSGNVISIDTATTTNSGASELADAAEADARTDSTRAITAVSLANTPVAQSFDIIGDDSTTDFAKTHNFNTRDQLAEVWEAQSPFGKIEVDIEANTVNQSTVKFAVAPATGTDYRLVIHSIQN